ncbi:MAG: hypothetical protein ACXWDN_06690 [Limisphaerales bacterium]
MTFTRLLFALLLFPLWVPANDLYSQRSLSEKETLKIYVTLLHDACRHSEKFWTNSSADGRVGRWGTGRSDLMNEGIRAISGMVFASAALLKYSDVLTPAERIEYHKKIVAALRYATSTHRTGTEKCTDGKPWGDSWQSAFWTGTMSVGAWLVWHDLDTQTRKDVERVLTFEADRFLAIKPPAGSFNDTKAEENGWNLTCIATAANMFPNHPHAAAWQQKAIEYMMNTLSAPQDATDKTIVDGRPVSEWFNGANVHSDFTLENHGFFHPSYVACSCYFLTDTAMIYSYAHRPIPQAATHHLLDTWGMFEKYILPTGEAAYPQGMDWELRGVPYINLFASLARYQSDAFAARVEKTYLQYFRTWQQMGHGDLAVPGSSLGFTRHGCTIDQFTWAFLAHKIFNAPRQDSSLSRTGELEGVQTYDAVQVITHRTRSKFVSFSWTNHVFGMMIPIGDGHEKNPDFTVPIRTGLIGSFNFETQKIITASGKLNNPGVHKGKAVVTEHSWKKTGDGFETTGVVLLDGGQIKETLTVTSIGEKAVVFQDDVVALCDLTTFAERGVPVGIENDQITGDTRVVFHKAGKTKFDFHHPQRPFAVPGPWANVDGRLGMIAVEGSGMTYMQGTNYTPGMCVCTDVLYGSFSNERKSFEAGEHIAHRVAILCAEVSPRDTAAMAKTIRLENVRGVRVLHFQAPEGGTREVTLR